MRDGHEHMAKQDSASPDPATKGLALSSHQSHSTVPSSPVLSPSTFGKLCKRIMRRNTAQPGLEQTDLLQCVPTTTNATVAAGRNTEKHHRHPGPAFCAHLLSKHSPCMASTEGFCTHHRLSSPGLWSQK